MKISHHLLDILDVAFDEVVVIKLAMLQNLEAGVKISEDALRLCLCDIVAHGFHFFSHVLVVFLKRPVYILKPRKDMFEMIHINLFGLLVLLWCNLCFKFVFQYLL